MIIDIGAARLANDPFAFDVVVTPNLYGDVLSDIVAEIAGSVGLCGSANIGDACAMFEAIHGSAPDIAGRGVANPSGLILSAVQMLVHIGCPEIAENIQNAWLKTIEDGIHTGDVYIQGKSRTRAGTREFAEAVVARLGQRPEKLTSVSFAKESEPIAIGLRKHQRAQKGMVGVDVFIDWDDEGRYPERLAERLQKANDGSFQLTMVTNRGVKVWPEGLAETFCTDHWRCRFRVPDGQSIDHEAIIRLLGRIRGEGLDFIKTETLCTFDGKDGFSKGQGE